MKIKRFVVGWVFTNCYVVTDEATGKTVIIDPGEFTDEIKSAVDAVGKENVEYILLTHCHFDHMLGAAAAHEYTAAPVSIYKDDAEGLSDPVRSALRSFSIREIALPSADVTFSDGEKFKAGNMEFTVLHTPGHTKGGCLYICDGCIFSGDTLFAAGCGRTDLPTGNTSELLSSLRRIARLEGDYEIYPGHGEATTLSFERRNNPYMVKNI